MILFVSDYLEGCLPQILDRLTQTNFEQTPGYGEDPHCAHAADLIRTACDSPNASVHFLVGGTQTNATVISSILKPFQGVICADTGHINTHETGAVEHTGHKVLDLPTADGKLTAAMLRETMHLHVTDANREHSVQPGIVYISFPTERGTIYSRNELAALSAECKKWGLPLYLDGARLGYGLCSPECDLTLADIASLTDVFYIGGTKQGALFGEAVVFSNPILAKDFRYAIKQNGGLLAKGRLLGVQYEVLFEDGLYFKAAQKAIDAAMTIRAALIEKGVGFLNDSTTNQIFPILPNSAIKALRREFSIDNWGEVDSTHTAVRICTSWATTEDNVRAFVDAISTIL